MDLDLELSEFVIIKLRRPGGHCLSGKYHEPLKVRIWRVWEEGLI